MQLEQQLEEHRGRAHRPLHSDPGVGVRGGRRGPGDVRAGLVCLRALRGPGVAGVLALRIATNVCLDMLGSSQRRARPIDLASRHPAGASVGDGRSDVGGIRPIPSSHASQPLVDPAEQAVTREAIRHAFVAALMHLPPRQRSVLILREVLRWNATEVAELLGTTLASVNSALQRARSTLAARHATADAVVSEGRPAATAAAALRRRLRALRPRRSCLAAAASSPPARRCLVAGAPTADGGPPPRGGRREATPLRCADRRRWRSWGHDTVSIGTEDLDNVERHPRT